MPKKIGYAGKIPVLFLKEGEMFVVFSPALDLSTCGPTYSKARKNFEEAAQIFFDECIKRGTLEEALTACGWHKVYKHWQPPVVVGQDSILLEVPSTN